ncbi:MAG: transcription-repair coupling factor [Firmicutes bacterium]|nr:transcription-repair coupling factor [Bacillota bacterium]
MHNGLLEAITESNEFEAVLDGIAHGQQEQLVYGLSSSQKSYFLAGLYLNAPSSRPFIIVSYSTQQAERLFSDLKTFLSPDELLFFPPREVLPNEDTREGVSITSARLQVEEALLRGDRKLMVVVPVKSLARKLIPADVFRGLIRTISIHDLIDLQDLAADLVFMGYQRMEKVEDRGGFSIRGGIVDIYPLASEHPVRIEFFDDEVDSIREFNGETQRSIRSLQSVTIIPCREFVMRDEIRAAGLRALESEVGSPGLGKAVPGKGNAAGRLERLAEHLEKLKEGVYFDSDEQYLPYFYPDMQSLLDYATNPVVILDEPARLKEALIGFTRELHEDYISLLEKGQLLPEQVSIFAQPDEVFDGLSRRQSIWFILMSKGLDLQRKERVHTFSGKPAEVFHGKFDLLAKDVKNWKRKRYRVAMVVSTEERAARLVETLREEEIGAIFVKNIGQELRPGNIVVTVGHLESGFEFPSLRLMVLTDNEIYGNSKQRARLAPVERGARIASYLDLDPGDYVVHVNHGIGKYLGVETLEVAGAKRDYLVVKYAGEDRLYVPTDQVELLQKYIGIEDSPPKLYKLGGTEWAKVRNRVKESVRDIAKGLLELYAARETIQGHAFSPDTVWQKEFEDAFPYEETPDQWRAIQEVKRDMEKQRPMDRLLCGDVGYGKTEVALRAAFKAVMDSKQVAMLVPTTILAQQHFTTFTDRFQGFPVNIAVLSRFQSNKEQKEILRKLRKGEMDIVIGTHRLLQPDVKFKDLGLLVVDEEQRFGVLHKERLKELRHSVDVLTLTATPIPRTLHMALVGIRDMSVINTPPEDRFPVKTYVVEHDESLIREAILREMDRGGQVYFVCNRVQSIDNVVRHLSELVPEARIGVAHGQMYDEHLERVMLQFLDREYDVLVCTTIIENGLDIPNVNTLVVLDADHMGLAQLYQLRGRVGRSNRVAYAYFMYRKEKVLSEVAEKRLQAIKEFTDLGSGFKIAMRDLEIRGAGNILGPEQHGHIASVGFELYARMLRESISELKGEGVSLRESAPEVSIELGISAFISDDYIPDSKQKIEIYKKISRLESLDDVDELEAEVCDRFGKPPIPVQCLLGIARVKIIAREMGVASIIRERDVVSIRFDAGIPISGEVLMNNVVRPNRGRVTVSFGRSPVLKVKVGGMADLDLVKFIDGMLSGSGIGERRVASG